MKFEPATFTPRPIPGVAASPRFAGKAVNGLRVVVTDVARIEPLEMGMHVLAALAAEARSKVHRLFPNLAMFNAIAGTQTPAQHAHRRQRWRRHHRRLASRGRRFKAQRARYLIY